MGSFASAVAAKGPEPGPESGFAAILPSSRMRTLLLCLILIGIVLVPYNRVIHNGFIRYDDDTYITDNAHVKAGLTWVTVKWSLTTFDAANWHPLTWLSHALDCQLFGLNPAGHHYVSVLLHAINAVLLFVLLQNATGFRWRSLMIAALFALHPIKVESVAWAAERKTLLSTMFFLLAMIAYGSYVRRPGIARYAAVILAFALALMCKPQVITFPFLLLLWDYWPLCRTWSEKLVLEKLPLLLLSVASGIVTIRAQRAGGAVKSFIEYSPLLRLETAVVSYASYLGKALWPAKLAGLYPHSARLYPTWQVAAALILLALITVCVFRVRAGKPYLLVGWFWFLGSLVPMLGLVQVGFQSMADRYAYIPFIGLFLMVVWLAGDWIQDHKFPAYGLAFPAVCCLLALGALTYRQIEYWRDTQTFWLHTLAVTENNYLAEDNLGEFLFSQNRTDEAAARFREAVAIRPDDLTANLNLGAYEYRRGNLATAIEHYRLVAKAAIDPSLRETAYTNLGFVYRQTGRASDATECFEAALKVSPNSAKALLGLGLIAQGKGDLAEAIRMYSAAAKAQPSEVADLLLAQAMQLAGHQEEAKAIYDRLASSPHLAEAQMAVQSLAPGK